MYKELTGSEFLRIIPTVYPFNKENLHVKVILATLQDTSISETDVQGWSPSKKKAAYRKIISDSPDILFMEEYKIKDPIVENMDALDRFAKDEKQCHQSRYILENAAQLCKEQIVQFLEATGFRKSFKEIIITGNIGASISKRRLPGFMSPFVVPSSPAAVVQYTVAPDKEKPITDPRLFINPLIMLVDQQHIDFIFLHELMHLLQDHLHSIILDTDIEHQVEKKFWHMPHAILSLADELLREALVENALYHIRQKKVRPTTFITNLWPIRWLTQDPDLGDLDKYLRARIMEPWAKLYVQVEVLWYLLSVLPSYWVARAELPEVITDILEKLPREYQELYNQLAALLPEIVKDGMVEFSEFEATVDILLNNYRFFRDYILYALASE